jgi:hypothetical protein
MPLSPRIAYLHFGHLLSYHAGLFAQHVYIALSQFQQRASWEGVEYRFLPKAIWRDKFLSKLNWYPIPSKTKWMFSDSIAKDSTYLILLASELMHHAANTRPLLEVLSALAKLEMTSQHQRQIADCPLVHLSIIFLIPWLKRSLKALSSNKRISL